MSHIRVALVVISGSLLTWAVASWYGMSVEESWDLASVAASGALVAGAIAALALWLLRKRSLGLQLVTGSLAGVIAVAAGAIVAARSMFFSEHDLHSLFVMVTASATVGVAITTLIGMRIASAGRAIRDAAGQMSEGPVTVELAPGSAEELRAIARELEEISARLHEARDKERALDSSRRELVAWVSHDLRTPLAGIRAMAEALEDGVVSDDDTVDRYHRTMREEADRLALLVDDLFELSRINAGALRLDFEKVRLDELVSEALAATAGVARAKGVRVEGKMAGDSPTLELSPPEITRVLRNLLENAIRHTPADGSVFVEAGTREQSAYVRVADACGGIPEDDIARVFDMAFRGQSERSRDGGGGLGLAIARGIVQAHAGDISVENGSEGCLFTVTLPLTGRPA